VAAEPGQSHDRQGADGSPPAEPLAAVMDERVPTPEDREAWS
jgi:hypothetical protein